MKEVEGVMVGARVSVQDILDGEEDVGVGGSCWIFFWWLLDGWRLFEDEEWDEESGLGRMKVKEING